MGLELFRGILGPFQPVSALSHLFAALVAMAAAIPLVLRARRNKWRVVALSVYASCVITSLAVSGAYHAQAQGTSLRALMQRLDHYAIWMLIAGTYTAVHGTLCRGWFWRTGILVFIWSYAVTGMLLQVYRFDVFSGLPGLALYLGMGWVGVLSMIKLKRKFGWVALFPFALAGVAYTLGATLEAVGHPVIVAKWVGPHEIFHFAVIIGVALHWRFIAKHQSVMGHDMILVAVPADRVLQAPFRPGWRR